MFAFGGLLILIPAIVPSAHSQQSAGWLNALGLALVVAAVLLWVYAPGHLPAVNPVLKRVAAWTAVAVVLLAWYVASAAPIKSLTGAYCPAVYPAASVFYSPLETYVLYEFPGSELIGEYTQWWYWKVFSRLQ